MPIAWTMNAADDWFRVQIHKFFFKNWLNWNFFEDEAKAMSTKLSFASKSCLPPYLAMMSKATLSRQKQWQIDADRLDDEEFKMKDDKYSNLYVNLNVILQHINLQFDAKNIYVSKSSGGTFAEQV